MNIKIFIFLFYNYFSKIKKSRHIYRATRYNKIRNNNYQIYFFIVKAILKIEDKTTIKTEV